VEVDEVAAPHFLSSRCAEGRREVEAARAHGKIPNLETVQLYRPAEGYVEPAFAMDIGGEHGHRVPAGRERPA
jgi:hypothetical protein